MSDIEVTDATSTGRIAPEKRTTPGLGDRFRRALFSVVWFCCCRPSPVALHGWRRMALRMFGAKMGFRTLVYPSVRIWAPWNLEMEDRSVLGPGVDCYNVDLIWLGEGALVSQRAYLCSASHDLDAPEFPLISAPIRLESKAWVCADAFIGPGVTVGFGAVVGARAVVMRSVDSQLIVAGNPARQVGRRNDSAVSESAE